METYELILMIAIGLALLFFGYRVKKIAFFLIWFLLGFNLTTFLMPTINNMVPQIAGQPLWQNLIPICGGLLLALMGFSIEKLCVGGICFVLVMVLAINYFGTDIATLAIAGVIGVIAAGAAVTLMKPATILATSLAGAYALTIALLVLFPQISKEIYYFPAIGIFTLIGALFQFSTTKHVM